MMKRTLAACFLATTVLAAPALAQGTNFITEQSATQWRASKFVGVDIYGADNAKIGDVNEVLLDSSGNAQAVVIGVGGFLGIGEKNVAVPFASVQWKSEPVKATTASTAPRSDVAATGTTANPSATTAPAATVDTAAQGYPDHGMLAMTKADLQGAPDFKYYGARTASTSTTTTAPAAPAATAPAGGMSSPMGGAPATAPKP